LFFVHYLCGVYNYPEFMETLYKKHKILISQVNMEIVRDTMHTINWERQLVAIRGSRGVGKTTLIRQFIRQKYGTEAGVALYCVMDSLYFTNHTLSDLAENFHLAGGRHLFLDEVHKYPTWSKEIKEIIDLYPDLKICFTGSSLLQILNADADLSRRVLSYNMAGLSFREYLRFYHKISLPSYTLIEIISKADEICDEVCKVCSPQPLFNAYLRAGYYPFFDGNETEYYSRLENVVSFIIDQEITQFCNVDPAYTRKLKALILYLCNNVPYEVNISKLATYLEINKATVLNYLAAMHRAELITLIYCDNKSVSKMQKPDKIFIHNTNILNALSNNTVIGTIRECFVVNQLSQHHTVEYSKEHGDFMIDSKILFEVGGKEKTFNQIAGIDNSYILADDIEMPIGHKLPLWIVGMEY